MTYTKIPDQIDYGKFNKETHKVFTSGNKEHLFKKGDLVSFNNGDVGVFDFAVYCKAEDKTILIISDEDAVRIDYDAIDDEQ